MAASVTRGDVEAFVLVLGQALHDVQHETGADTQVLHFWDTDSLYFPIFGSSVLPEDSRLDQSILVQALYSAGFVGQVSLLRPHRGELLSQMSSWGPLGGSRIRRRPPVAGRAQFESLVALATSLAAPGELDDATVAAALQSLRRTDRRAFILLEGLQNDWRERLERLLREPVMLDLERHGPDIASVRDAAEFEPLTRAINRYRVPQRPLATAVDVASLVALARLNQAAKERKGVPFARFFTSSSSMQRVYQESELLQQLLSYDDPDGGRSTIWRTSQYYFLRAIFPALGMANSRRSRLGGPSLEQLESLRKELDDAFRVNPSTLESLLQQRLFGSGESSVGALISDLESSRMSQIWLSYSAEHLEPDPRFSLAGLSRLRDDPRTAATAESVEMAIEQSLGAEIRDLRTTSRALTVIDRLLPQYARRRGVDRISLRSDLVSVRFGVEWHDSRDEVSVEPGVGGIAPDLVELLDPASFRGQPEKALRPVLILLGLEQWELAARFVGSLGLAGSDPTFVLAAHFGEINVRRNLDEGELRERVSALLASWELLGQEDRSRMAVGYATALLQGWTRSELGGAFAYSSPRDDYGWARHSTELVLESREGMTELQLLHALNHQLYVAALTNTLGDLGDELVLFDFEQLAWRQDNFHFLDTAGYALLRQAMSMRRSGDSNESMELRLRRSLRLLSRANQLFPDDVEVAQHLEIARNIDQALR